MSSTRFAKKWLYSVRHPIYRSWYAMKRRCTNINASDYKYYGGRGISFCRDWESYDKFYEDMFPGWSDGLQIDRIDNNKGYFKLNCRWVDSKTNCRNRRPTRSRMIKNNKTGEIKTITEWAEIYEISRNTITSRLRLGYTDFNILIQKSHGRGKRHLFHQNHFKEESRQVID